MGADQKIRDVYRQLGLERAVDHRTAICVSALDKAFELKRELRKSIEKSRCGEIDDVST